LNAFSLSLMGKKRRQRQNDEWEKKYHGGTGWKEIRCLMVKEEREFTIGGKSVIASPGTAVLAEKKGRVEQREYDLEGESKLVGQIGQNLGRGGRGEVPEFEVRS